MKNLNQQIPSSIYEAAQKLAPIVHLHPEEKYAPCSVEWYFQNVSLWSANTTEKVPTGEVTGDKIIDIQKSCPTHKLSLRVQQPNNDWGALNPNNKFYFGQNVEKDNVPCYYSIRTNDGITYYIQYYFFYAYNGGMLPNNINSDGYDAHEGDWEYITVMLKNSPPGVEFHAIAFSGHGYVTDWKINENPVKMPINNLGPITVYSALHSHASYMSAGKHDLLNIPGILRPFVDGYDVTADGGATWNTGENLVQITEDKMGAYNPVWANFVGDWGTDVEVSGTPEPKRKEGPSGPMTKGYELDNMGTVDVFYKPQNGQSFRCSSNFPNWSVPPKGSLNVQVLTDNQLSVPVFAFDHDKKGADTRWYSNKQGGDIFVPSSENGGSGTQNIYIGTTCPLPYGMKGNDTYKVIVRWSAEKKSQRYPSRTIPSGATLISSVSVYYQPQHGQSFRCSDNFPNWDTQDGDILYWEIELSKGHNAYPIFAINHDKVGSDSRWYTGVTNGACFSNMEQNGGGGCHSLYIGTISPLPQGVKGSDTYTVKAYKLKR